MKMFACKFAQDEVTHQRLRVSSKKSVQQGREWFSVSRRGPPLFDAWSVCVIREHGKMARTPLAAFFNRPRLAFPCLETHPLACLASLLRRRSFG
jgi:hypothetical protein